MDQRITDEIKKRRTEACPPRVLERVRGRVRQQRTVFPRLAFAGVAVVLLAVLAVTLIRPTLPENGQLGVAQKTVDTPVDSARAAREMYASLAFFGQTLLEAGEESGRVIFKKTQTSFQKGWGNITETIDQHRK